MEHQDAVGFGDLLRTHTITCDATNEECLEVDDIRGYFSQNLHFSTLAAVPATGDSRAALALCLGHPKCVLQRALQNRLGIWFFDPDSCNGLHPLHMRPHRINFLWIFVK
jgi:hypothetical protein